MKTCWEALLLSLASMLVAAGCGTAHLRANFENDVVGRPPILDLPGEPDGDRLEVSQIESQQLVAIANSPWSEGKVLRASSLPFRGHRIDLKFIPTEHPYSNGLWRVNATIYMAPSMEPSNADFFFKSSDDKFLGGLLFNRGRLSTIQSEPPGPVTPVNGSYSSGEPLFLTVMVDMDSRTITYSMLSDSNRVDGIETPMNPDASDFDHIILYLFSEDDRSVDYYVEDVLVKELE